MDLGVSKLKSVLRALESRNYLGMFPFGNLGAVALASKIGAPNTVMIGGLGCILASLAFARQLSRLKRLILPVYTKIGLIPKAS